MRERTRYFQAAVAAGLIAATIGCGTGGGASAPASLSAAPGTVAASAKPLASALPQAAASPLAPVRPVVASPAASDDALDANIMAKVQETLPQETRQPAAVPSPTFKVIKPEDLDPDNLPVPFTLETVDRSDGQLDITQANGNALAGGLAAKSLGGGKDIPIDLFIKDPRVANRAKWWGIHTAHDLLMAGKSPFRRWVLKFKLGGLFYPRWFPAYVLYWVEQADLLRIPGVTPQYAFMLQMSGITSVPDLARWAFLDQLSIYTNMGTVALTYGIFMPSFTEFKSWVEAARNLPAVIY